MGASPRIGDAPAMDDDDDPNDAWVMTDGRLVHLGLRLVLEADGDAPPEVDDPAQAG